jgi:hypothetical protein
MSESGGFCIAAEARVLRGMIHPDHALVLFSGGQDSAACLAWALDHYAHVETVGFDYGQRHAVEMVQRGVVREKVRKAFPAWAARLGPDHRLDLSAFGAIGDTALTTERAFEMTARGLPNTFVPGRNLVFLTWAAALADRRGLRRACGMTPTPRTKRARPMSASAATPSSRPRVWSPSTSLTICAP